MEREAASYSRNRLTRLLDEVANWKRVEGERLLREGERLKMLDELKVGRGPELQAPPPANSCGPCPVLPIRLLTSLLTLSLPDSVRSCRTQKMNITQLGVLLGPDSALLKVGSGEGIA